MERRRRSNGLHAQTSEEYLEKLEVLDSIRSKTPPRRPDNHFQQEVFYIQPPEEDLELQNNQPTSQQVHKVLVMGDNLKVTHKQINELLEHDCSDDGLSGSTQDEIKPYLGNCDSVLPIDLYIMKRTIETTQHIFQFWIQNSLTHPKIPLFEETYYNSFTAFVHVYTASSEGLGQVKSKLQGTNPNLKSFTLTRDCEYCLAPLKKIKIAANTSYSTEYQCGSFVEVVDQLLK